jgi:hypothetical protein
MEPEKICTVRQQLGKQIPMATDTNAIEELLETVFPMRSVPKLYNETISLS